MADKSGTLSFAAIERELGLPEPAYESEDYPLLHWYRAVRTVPLGELTAADLARACRQQLYPSRVVPFALAILDRSPLAGEMYDGELFASLKSIPLAYWSDHAVERAELLSIIDRLLAAAATPEDVRRDAEELRGRVEQ
jgi:hypothetical protein